MDTKEYEASEYLEAVEAPFIQRKAPPVWSSYEPEKKKKWHLGTPLLTEYYHVVDDPKRLPTILHPLISKDRAFTFGGVKPSYHNFQFYAPDEFGVHRRLYLNICHENFIVGAIGATLIGVSTRHFMPSRGRLHSFIAQRFLLGRPLAPVTKTLLTGSLMTASICWKLASRSVTGGLLYDLLKRSNNDDKHEPNDHWINAGIAGGICGLLFGIRGGLPHAWTSASCASLAAVISEFMPAFAPTPKH